MLDVTTIPATGGMAAYRIEDIDPVLASGHFASAVSEPAEQIYRFGLFTPAFCRFLIETAEARDDWRTRADVLDHPYAQDDSCKSYCFPDTTVHLERLGLAELYEQVVRRHLEPLIGHLWPVFRMQKINPPYVMRYEPGAVRGMAAHYDLETIALVVYLNERYEGGGTRFPRWNYETGKPPVGTAIMFPGGLSHVHEGLPIASGTRYLMCGAFY